MGDPIKPDVINRIGVHDIMRVVAAHHGMRVKDLLIPRRDACFTRPRQVAMYLARRLTSRSDAELGRMFHRDRTTVRHAVERVQQLCADDADFAAGVMLCAALSGDTERSAHAEAAERLARELIDRLKPALIQAVAARPTEVLAQLRAIAAEAAAS